MLSSQNQVECPLQTLVAGTESVASEPFLTLTDMIVVDFDQLK